MSDPQTVFGTVVNAFAIAELAIQAASRLGQCWGSRSLPSQSRIDAMQQIVESWRRWISALSAEERRQFEVMYRGQLGHMESQLSRHQLELHELALNLRFAGSSTLHMPSNSLRKNPLDMKFKRAEVAIHSMDRDYTLTTSQFREQQSQQYAAMFTPLPADSPAARNRSHQPLLPTVNPAHVLGQGTVASDAQVTAYIQREWHALRNRVTVQYLHRSLRTAVEVSNNLLGTVLQSAQASVVALSGRS